MLEVSKKVSTEATEIFYAVNKFTMSSYAAFSLPSVFTKNAALFRKVVFGFGNIYPWDLWSLEYHPMAERDKFTHLWRMQILAHAPLVNLAYLELNITNIIAPIENFYDSIETMKAVAANDLRPYLLANLPLSIRKKKGVRGHGIWISASWGIRDLYTFGEAWRELGINFELHPSYDEYVARARGADDPSGQCYFG